MSAAGFRLEESIGQRLGALGGRGEAIADARLHGCGPARSTRIRAGDGQVAEEATHDGDEAGTGDTDPTWDPLALDPLSPIAFEPGPAESAGPLVLDPLSPLRRDAS
jgi:hypothetical protein